jgi:thiamine-phosphate pyrophosphorylase
MKPLTECRLYTFVDTAYLRGRTVAEIARQLCDGGGDIIQLRAKSYRADDVQRMVEAIAHVTERAGVHLVVNDHVDVARTLPRPFCHLGQEDFFDAGWTHVSQLDGQAPREGSRFQTTAGSRALQVGLSTHSPAQAELAVAAGADYIAIGPVYATGTKPTARPVTIEYVRWAAVSVPLPWFAIGGITLDKLDELLAAGARRICVVSAILNAPDISETCQRLRERLFSAPL